MHFYIWPTFSIMKVSIINNRYILNKMPNFQTTLVCSYLYILDQASRPKQTFEEKTKFKFNHLNTKFKLKSQI